MKKKELNLLLEELKLELETKFKNNFTGLVLFGSYAKNTQTKNSDLDIIITFKTLPKSPVDKFSLIREIIMEFEDKYNINLSPILITESNLKDTPLIIDIAQYAQILIDKNNKINTIFSKINKKYSLGIYQKILIDNHYMLKIENG